MLGGHAPQKVIDQKKEELGLNRPMIVQYGAYLWQICRLDLGKSMIFEENVKDIIRDKIPATLELTICGMVICVCVGVFLGVYAADKRRTFRDYAIRLFGIVIYCIPVYWLGLMFQLVFGVWLDLFPVAGRVGARLFTGDFEWTGMYLFDALWAMEWSSLADIAWHLCLPSFTLGLVLSGIFIRLTRASMLDVLKADYIVAAEARGIRHARVVYKYAFLNAFVPILTMMGLQFAYLISGALLTETTFSWPGMGRLLLERIYLRDYPTIQGVIVIYALIVALVSLIVDIIYSLVDPRVRY
jgi:peptide/nickel transport system permease protein